MAKDSEKLIRQLSLLAFLMAQPRPVSAIEIRQEVQGYIEIVSDEAFNRRFYADRADLVAQGIELEIVKTGEGCYDAEYYSLGSGVFHLAAIDPTEEELGRLNAIRSLLGPEFAYAKPLSVLLERLSWVRPPAEIKRKSLSRSIPGRSHPLARLDTAIHRRKRVKLDYRGMRLEVEPYQLRFSDRFHLIGRVVREDEDWMVVIPLSEIEGKVGYATKAERDFQVPEDFDPELSLSDAHKRIAALEPAASSDASAGEDDDADGSDNRQGIVPDGLSRLLGLARLLLTAPDGRLPVDEVCERMLVTESRLRADLDALNVVNFGGGNYVLYAEIVGDVVEVDPDVHAERFARPMRILPLEARALLAAIDLARGQVGGRALRSLRAKVVDALGGEPPGLRIVPAPTPSRPVAAGSKGRAERPATPDLMGGLSAPRSGGRRSRKGGSPVALPGGRPTASRSARERAAHL